MDIPGNPKGRMNMKIKELIEKLQKMPPDGNVEFISGMFLYDTNVTYEMHPYKPNEKEKQHGH